MFHQSFLDELGRIAEKSVVHRPELPLVARAMCRFGGRKGMRVVAERVLAPLLHRNRDLGV
jgi:hypothetical protein